MQRDELGESVHQQRVPGQPDARGGEETRHDRSIGTRIEQIGARHGFTFEKIFGRGDNRE